MTDVPYYSQQREDQWIAENLELPEKGFYVDIGCGHPFTTSNTAFLRDRKWKGLAIDGFRGWAEEWKDIPAFYCAVISSETIVYFKEDHGNPYHSRISEVELPMIRVGVRLEHLLSERKVGQIDFLSIDVEGSEFDVLSSLNFDLHDPSILVVEHSCPHAGRDLRIEPFMVQKGYRLRYENPINLIFTK